MKDLVVIKSFSNGINLILNPDGDFEDILAELSTKFASAKSFFGKGNMALSYEGRVLSSNDEMKLIDCIRMNCDVNLLCIVGKDLETNEQYVKAIESIADKFKKTSTDGEFYRGSLALGQTIETPNSLIVLGDVPKGSSVISGKNVIVLGHLDGTVKAGLKGGDDAFVVALSFGAQKLQIGEILYQAKSKSLWGLKSKAVPVIAFTKDGEIIIDKLTKEFPKLGNE